jgi:hypothetical protein
MKHVIATVLLGLALGWLPGVVSGQTKQTCCQKAVAEKRECANRCCQNAHKNGRSCQKCNPNKEDAPLYEKKAKDGKSGTR